MLTHLIRSKGAANVARRGYAIASRVGMTPGRMERSLVAFSKLLARYDAPATFPMTATALARNPGVLAGLLAGPAAIESAVHGCRHVDHSLLPESTLPGELSRAREIFAGAGIPVTGFRAPYLRWNDDLLTALRTAGFQYDSSRSVLWPVVDRASLSPAQTAGLNTLLDFCRPLPTDAHPALPVWAGGLLEIPVSFPDDEMMVERLGLTDSAAQAALWTAVLARSHARGELFVLQLHPERFFVCADALAEVLTEARTLRPPLWIASLGEIMTWWREKAALCLKVTSLGDGRWQVGAEGPTRGTVLVRGAAPDVPSQPWDAQYRLVPQRSFTLKAAARPCIGLSGNTPPELARFLRDQGYAVETGGPPEDYAFYLANTSFSAEEMLPLLAQIEASPAPLVRFGRWPGGAASGLAITGDIDALTVWDYGLRLAGR
jgi:peptidoglycan/xylan/chitin deacetylase (PgdA/CDA1 family)